jgi:hypothetical protein
MERANLEMSSFSNTFVKIGGCNKERAAEVQADSTLIG